MKVCDTARELFDSVNGAVRLSPDRSLTLSDPERFRNELVDTLVWTAVFSADAGAREAARWLIWEGAHALGAHSASIQGLYAARGKGWMQRIGEMFTDPRTWSAMLYMLLMLPLGITYFTLIVTLMTTAIACIFTPILLGFGAFDGLLLDGYAIGPWWMLNDYDVSSTLGWWQYPVVFLFGVVLLFGTMHLARGIGRMHGLLAKHLLVKSAQYA